MTSPEPSMTFMTYLIHKVCVIFTDGEASKPEDVPAASKLWADEGIPVFAVGIGNEISHKGLKAIAGADDRAMEVSNFAAIGDLAKPLLKKVCKTIGEFCLFS